MNKQKGYTAIQFIIVLVALAGVAGWVMNIVDIVQSDFSPLTTLLVLRFIGVFVPPLGAVLGYV